jgi:hypothetical protein
MNERTIKNHVLGAISLLTGKLYRDEDWRGVWNLVGVIESLGYEVECGTVCGGYRTNREGQTWKEYELTIKRNDVEVRGTLVCSAAGTVSNPFGAYDICLCF